MRSSSLSEVLGRFRDVFTGEGAFFATTSWTADLGLYFGRPDEVTGRGRRDAERVTALNCGTEASLGFWKVEANDALRRVMVFESGVPDTFGPGDEELAVRDEETAMLTALKRRDSFNDCFAFLSPPFPSLLITSARALPTDANPSECRMELRVVGLALWLPVAVSIAGMTTEPQ